MTELTPPATAPGYEIEPIVEPSGLHSANGAAFGPDGRLYVASVMGESIFAFDIATGAIEVAAPPFAGEADDLVFTPDGEMIWTGLLEGVVRVRRKDGSIQDLASDIPAANSIALTRDAKRLFVGQVFLAEGLWEVDLAGARPPRLVAEKTGGLNAAQFGPDGLLYAPSWERGQVVRVDPDSGEITTLAEGFKFPVAVRFDGRDRLYALDAATGELSALDAQDGRYVPRVIARMATGLDNFMFGANGLAYVTNMVDNAIYEVDPETGVVRTLISGRLGFPRALALTADPGGDVLHIADGCAYRTLDTRTLEITDVARACASTIRLPTGISVRGRDVLLVCESFNTVQLFDRQGEPVRDVGELTQPSAGLLLDGGDFLVTEPASGSLLRIRGEARDTLATGLQQPAGLADAGDGTVLVAESGTGRVLRVAIEGGEVSVLAEGFGALRAVAVGKSGLVAALDVDGGRVLTLDPHTGRSTLVAHDLPVGYLRQPYPRSGGLAVGSDDTIYVSADKENALYRIRRADPPAPAASRRD